MGSYSSSSSNSTNIDKRQVVDANAIGISADGGSVVSMLDGGAIERAFAFAMDNSKRMGESFEKLLGFQKDAMSMTDGTKVAELAAEKVSAAYEGASGQKIILYGVLVVAGLWLLQRKGRAA